MNNKIEQPSNAVEQLLADVRELVKRGWMCHSSKEVLETLPKIIDEQRGALARLARIVEVQREFINTFSANAACDFCRNASDYAIECRLNAARIAAGEDV
jgi:hypothetical protein